MGERTQVLQIIRTDLPFLANNQFVSGQFLHNQWGLGKVMPLLLIGQLTKIHSMRLRLDFSPTDSTGDKGDIDEIKALYDSVCQALKVGTGMTSNYSHIYGETIKELAEEQADIAKIMETTYYDLPEVINQYGDNNNGYMVMVFTLQPHEYCKYNLGISVETAFISKSLNNGRKPKYLTAKQYMKSFIRGKDNYGIGKTNTALNAIMSYFDDDFENSENQWANLDKHLDSETLATLQPFKTYAPALVQKSKNTAVA